MAKSKPKHKVTKPVKISPARFMREKARSFPLGDCYCTEMSDDKGMCQVIVTRKRSNGNLLVGVFLIDLWCLGVKDCYCRLSVEPDSFDEMTEALDNRFTLNKISYDEAHNLIYGAIEFAQEVEIDPHPDFDTVKYILEEDTDDIPLIEYEFGRKGKRVLVVGPDGRELSIISDKMGRIGEDFEIITLENLISEVNDYDDDDEADEPLDPGEVKS